MFTLWIQARGARNPPNLLNNQALGRISESPPPPRGRGANGTWVTLYYQDMGYSFRRRTAGLLPRGNA